MGYGDLKGVVHCSLRSKAKGKHNVSIDKVEAEIRSIYERWSEIAPGVTPREHGRLGKLWRWADSLYAQEG